MSDLSKMPASPPPPGVTPNFDNPPSTASGFIAAMVIGAAFSTIFVGVRLYTRMYILKPVGWDDWFSVLGWAGIIVFVGMGADAIANGGAGVDIWNITAAEARRYKLILNWANVIYSVVMCAIKVSISMLLIRLFVVQNKRHTSAYIINQVVIWINVLFYAAHFFVTIWSCQPREKILNSKVPGKCIDLFALFQATSVLNIVTGLLVMWVPFRILWKLQMSMKRRMGMYSVFAIGGLSVAASIARLVVAVDENGNKNLTVSETTIFLWVFIEMAAALVVGCMPVTPIFFRHLYRRVRKIPDSSYTVTKRTSPTFDLERTAEKIMEDAARGSDSSDESGMRFMIHKKLQAKKSGPNLRSIGQSMTRGWPGRRTAQTSITLQNDAYLDCEAESSDLSDAMNFAFAAPPPAHLAQAGVITRKESSSSANTGPAEAALFGVEGTDMDPNAHAIHPALSNGTHAGHVPMVPHIPAVTPGLEPGTVTVIEGGGKRKNSHHHPHLQRFFGAARLSDEEAIEDGGGGTQSPRSNSLTAAAAAAVSRGQGHRRHRSNESGEESRGEFLDGIMRTVDIHMDRASTPRAEDRIVKGYKGVSGPRGRKGS